MLKVLVGDRGACIPEAVAAECRMKATQHPSLTGVLGAAWLPVVPVIGEAGIRLFGELADVLIEGRYNRGEAEVIALGAQHGLEAVLDDRQARRWAKHYQVRCCGSLRSIVGAVNGGQIDRALASGLADEMCHHSWYPFEPGGFLAWADGEGLLSR